MISSRLPRWPDRDAAGPATTHPLRVKACGEVMPSDLALLSDGVLIAVHFVGDSPSAWPDEGPERPAVPPPFRLDWVNVVIWGTIAVSAGMWVLGALHILMAMARFP